MTPAVLATAVKSNSTTTAVDVVQVESVQNADSCKLMSSNENSPFEAYGYKTLEEFLGMPEVAELSYKKNETDNKPKALFKSQFWDYLDPHKKREDERYTKNKEKPYDPVEVKSYMEKQKEIRKLKETREYRERQWELERKKKLLHDLNEKCRSINARRSLVARKSVLSTAPTPTESQVLQNGKLLNHKPRHSESAVQCSSIKSPSTRGAESSSNKGKYSSEQDINATILLKEFEDIVKKECMQVLKHHMNKIPGESNKNGILSKPQTYDKAVETTISLERNENLLSKDSSVISSLTDDAIFVKRLTADHRLTQSQLNIVVTKIQSWFRGCQARKQLREANIIPYLRHKKDARCRRRMSFYRTPEKPYDSPMQRRLSCVSPARIPAIAQAYIPAKESFNQVPSPHTSSGKRNSMPASLRLKPFDEPFPKEVIEKIQQQKQQLNVITKTASNARYVSDDIGNFTSENWQLPTCQYGSHLQRQFASADSPLSTLVQSNVSTYRKIPAPTIAEVLKEKVRAFSQELQSREMIKVSLPRKSSSDNYIHNGYQNTDPRYKHDIEVDSYSEPPSATQSHLKDYRHHSGEGRASCVLTPETPEKSDATEVSHHSRRSNRAKDDPRKRKTYRTAYNEDSTTTVDTDIDLVSSTSREISMASHSTEVSMMKSTTEQNGITTTTNLPSSVNIQSLPTPALELCYKAEVERMHVLEKAYLCTLNHERKQEQRRGKEQETKFRVDFETAQAKLQKEERQEEVMKKLKKEQLEIQEIMKKRFVPTPLSSDVNLALMNCQKEALSATAEIAKLMSELKKSSVEKDFLESQQQPVNLASMVYAAVDEARRRDDEKRQKRREIEKRRALKEKEEREREIPPVRLSGVTCHDKQVQFPTSSMCDSSSSVTQQVPNQQRRRRRPDVAKKSEMTSVSKAQGQLEKQLQQTKKVLQGMYTDEDISDNLSEHELSLTDHSHEIKNGLQGNVEQRLGTDDDKNSEEQPKLVTENQIENFPNDLVISERELLLPSLRIESPIVTEKDVLTETPQFDIEIDQESCTNLENTDTLNTKEAVTVSSIHSALGKSSQVQLISVIEHVISEQVKSWDEDVEDQESFEDEVISEDYSEMQSSNDKSLYEKSKDLENLSLQSNDLKNLSRKSNDLKSVSKISEHLEHMSGKLEDLENMSAMTEEFDNISENFKDLKTPSEKSKNLKSISKISIEDLMNTSGKTELENLPEKLVDLENISQTSKSLESILKKSKDSENLSETSKSLENNETSMDLENNETSKDLENKSESSRDSENLSGKCAKINVTIGAELLDENLKPSSGTDERDDNISTKIPLSDINMEEVKELFEVSEDKMESGNLSEKVKWESGNKNLVTEGCSTMEEKDLLISNELTKPSIIVEKDMATKTPPSDIEVEKESFKNVEENNFVNVEETTDVLKAVEAVNLSSILSGLSQSSEIIQLSSVIDEVVSEQVKFLDKESKNEDSFEDDQVVSEDGKETQSLKEDSESKQCVSGVLIEKDIRNGSDGATDAELSLENDGDISTEIPHSDIEVEEDEDTFEDDITSEDDERLLDKDHSVTENKSDDGNGLEAAGGLVDEQDVKTGEIVNPTTDTKSLGGDVVVDDENNFIIESHHFEIEGEEEEWFEDEMVSDGKEDEALKLEAAKIKEEQNRIENEIRALEALQAQVPPVIPRTNLSDIPDKPPPPYSPPTSDSFSVSSRSYVTAVAENKIKDIVVKEVDHVWDVWVETKTLPPMTFVDANEINDQPDASENSGFQSLQQTANRALNLLLTDFVHQTIQQLLLVHDGGTSYIEKVRPGPMALQAQQMRVPKSKTDLIETVLGITKENIPLGMVSDANINPMEYGTAWKKRLTKWSSRPRDQVDEILVEELIQENSEWTEFWPEELIVTDKACKKIVRSALRDVLLNLESASKK